MNPSRRTWLRRMALSPAVAALLQNAQASASIAPTSLSFGVISDVHQDVMPDGVQRIEAFAKAMNGLKPDFVIQLGDFCVPHERNRPFLEAWNTCSVPRYHVLGNHDMDGGYQREQTAKFYGMPGLHYAFNAGAVRCLVLDGNEPGGTSRGYKRFIAPEQRKWLRGELAHADRPLLLFVHQPLDGQVTDAGGYLENAQEIRDLLEQAEASQPGRIVAVFSGHLHLDYERVVHGIRYVQVNSASYYWLNTPAARRETFPSETHRKHPFLSHVAAYREPLWALVTLDFARGEMTITGRSSAWVGPDPWERGEKLQLSRNELQPTISNRHASLRPQS